MEYSGLPAIARYAIYETNPSENGKINKDSIALTSEVMSIILII